MKPLSSILSKGCVAAGSQPTAEAGADMLRQGGNAADAIVAAMLTAFVAEPVLTAPFGGGFAMLAGPQTPPVFYDFFANVPGLKRPAASQSVMDFQEIEVSYGPTTQIFYGGKAACAWPLLLPGLLALQATHGRLKRAQIFAPALAQSSAGCQLSKQVLHITHILEPILRLSAQSRQIFTKNDMLLKEGDFFYSADLHRFFQHLSQGGDLQPYEQALLEAFGTEAGGLLTHADKEHAEVHELQPLHYHFEDYECFLAPQPSMGGELLIQGLSQLQEVHREDWQDESKTYRHLFEAMLHTQHYRQTILDKKIAKAFAQVSHGSTTHISCIDKEGMAVAMTASNGEGCGYVIPGVGVMANNFLGEADINPLGFHQQPPGQRLLSMMSPTLVKKAGKVHMALGTGGSSRIRTALLQVLSHVLFRQQTIPEAVAMPRLHLENGPLYVEQQVLHKTLGAATMQMLKDTQKPLITFHSPNMFFGGVHVAAADNQQAVGDPRRAGCVAFS